MLVIREYVQSLPKEEQYCNGCAELHRQPVHGGRGQVVTAFCNGTNSCDEYELIWAIRGVNIERPLECILNGEKYIKERQKSPS
jgi:hypothetical protein